MLRKANNGVLKKELEDIYHRVVAVNGVAHRLLSDRGRDKSESSAALASALFYLSSDVTEKADALLNKLL